MILQIENNGPDILITNYFESDLAQRGGMYVSINAGAFRLLLPPGNESMLEEIQTASEIVVSRGKYWGQDALELLFDDQTDNPFSIHVGSNQIDRLPPRESTGTWQFSAWVQGPKCVYRSACYYRVVKSLPYLKPYGQ